MPNLFSTLRSLAREKLSLQHRENQLLTFLNRVLPSIGYKIVPATAPANGVAPSRSPMKARLLACPHCDRQFAQPLHLGRHMSAAHKTAARRTRRPARRRKTAAARSSRKGQAA
jgi:hypothetical protein